MLQALKDAGFNPPDDRMFLSSGVYHQEWIPVEHIRTAILEYKKLFNKTPTLDFEYPRADLGAYDRFIKELGHIDRLTISKRDVMYRFGREEELPGSETGLMRWTKFGLCGIIFRTTVDPGGKVFPCHGFNRDPSFQLGSLYGSSLAELEDAARSNEVLTKIMNQPMHELYAPLLTADSSLPTQFSSICEMCTIVTQHATAKKVIPIKAV